jgi:hypothetical protein
MPARATTPFRLPFGLMGLFDPIRTPNGHNAPHNLPSFYITHDKISGLSRFGPAIARLGTINLPNRATT